MKTNMFRTARFDESTGTTIGEKAAALATAFSEGLDAVTGLVILELALEQATGLRVRFETKGGDRANLSDCKAYRDSLKAWKQLESDIASR